MTASTGSPSVPADPASLSGAGFVALYDELAPVVFRLARHLGVQSHAIDDIVQEVFTIVHRRRGEFETRSTVKTWVTGIAVHVIHNFRRSSRRHDQRVAAVAEVAHITAAPPATPDQHVEMVQASAFMDRFLDTLDDDRRAVFVLVELQQLTAPEVVELTNTNLNTVYGRLRSARRLFEEATIEFRVGKETNR